ncbi:hypothetical protein CBOM_07480 [Ceraceosorus bombacis]|uniref:Uncharacterized protein n=1 Tax=Ceraceosorus bombacis TaxID=401625 RepID=A0A0P1BDH4_9BASI|nr:hypothetical protein CBOM_07480 [Ceraceosorus bombacis]
MLGFGETPVYRCGALGESIVEMNQKAQCANRQRCVAEVRLMGSERNSRLEVEARAQHVPVPEALGG